MQDIQRRPELPEPVCATKVFAAQVSPGTCSMIMNRNCSSTWINAGASPAAAAAACRRASRSWSAPSDAAAGL